MHDGLDISIVQGKKISSEDLIVINTARKKEFGSVSMLDTKPGTTDWENIHFLLRKKGRLVAFGRLHDLSVHFRGKTYPIFGIASILSFEKKKGYGSQLMQMIKQYIETSGKTAIGFCSPSVSPFYKKNGYMILPEGMKRFVYEDNIPEKDDALYLKGTDDLIEEMLTYPHEPVLIPRKPW